MQPERTTPDFSRRRWKRMLALLSLDAIAELYEGLGLEIKNQRSFQQALRKGMTEARNRGEDSSAGHHSASHLILERLQEQSGDDFPYFLQWSRETFIGTHADQPQVSVWDIVFSTWSNGRDWPSEIAPEKMAALAKDHKVRCSQSKLDEKIEAIKLKPLSDWDVEMYFRHNWNHFDEVNDPFITLSIMASVNCTRKFLETLVHEWTPEELQALTRGAQAVVDSLGVWMPGPVPTPEEALRA